MVRDTNGNIQYRLAAIDNNDHAQQEVLHTLANFLAGASLKRCVLFATN